MLKTGDKIGLIACSNSRTAADQQKLEELEVFLQENYQLETVRGAAIFSESGNNKATERAEALMQLYQKPEIKAIFDISGGDIANEILPLLDYKLIKQRKIPFSGYSDLTVILNAIECQTGVSSVLFLLTKLLDDSSGIAKQGFEGLFLQENSSPIQGNWLTPDSWQEPVILNGGNIRCLLKLAGTPYFPSLQNRVLFLESASGNIERVTTYFAQLEQMQVFSQVKGLIAGRFTEIAERDEEGQLDLLLKKLAAAYRLPLFRTGSIGHHPASLPLPIGKEVQLSFLEN